MKKVRNALAAGLAATAALLAGCGGAPGIDEVRGALLEDLRQSMAMAESLGVKIDLDELLTVKDVKGCEETRDGVYRCSVELTSKMLGMEHSGVETISFTKDSQGKWRAVE